MASFKFFLCLFFLLLHLSSNFGRIIPLIRREHHPSVQEKRGNGETFYLGGSIGTIFEFYASVYFGSPPGQNFLVQVDTGI